MRAFFRLVQILVVAAAGLGGPVALAADANHGAALAKRWCASCHLVESTQKQAKHGRSPVRRDRPQVGFHRGKGRLLPARPAPENAEFSAEPERGGRSRRLYRLAAQVSGPIRRSQNKAPTNKAPNANPCR